MEPYDWDAAHRRVDAHRAADVERVPVASPLAAIRAALRQRKSAVWIFGRRMFAHRDFLVKGGEKNHLHLRTIRSVLKDRTQIGNSSFKFNTVYLFEKEADGPSSCDASLATLAIAKKHGDAQCGILVPNDVEIKVSRRLPFEPRRFLDARRGEMPGTRLVKL